MKNFKSNAWLLPQPVLINDSYLVCLRKDDLIMS